MSEPPRLTTDIVVEIRKVQIEGGRLVIHNKLNTNFGSSEGEGETVVAKLITTLP
jgi:hypothetical protein